MKLIEYLHNQMIVHHRVNALVEVLKEQLQKNAKVLDVGCGSGQLAQALRSERGDIDISGIDVHVRKSTAVPVKAFDGERIPYDSQSFDTILLIDVLHHTQNAEALLKECRRVAKRVIVKDHYCENKFDHLMLRAMDRAGNSRFGIALPYNYLSKKEWEQCFATLQFNVDKSFSQLALYPFPLNAVFGRSLHFIVVLSHPAA